MDDANALVALSRFSVRYPNFSLGPLTLSFRPGERVAFVGPNGSGKTTTLRALAGRLIEYEGSVFLGGRELRALLPLGRRQIGLLPETLGGYSWMSVREHLAFVRQFYPEWDTDYADELVRRLRVPPDQLLGRLSKGSRVKVSFVAAESYRPRLLLLDEPTSGLDPEVRIELIDAVLHSGGARPDRVVIFSTHLLEDVELMADRVLLLVDGEVRLDESTARLREAHRGASLASVLFAAIAVHKRVES
jgi:ABC-2 type transport system ATP-binding protein